MRTRRAIALVTAGLTALLALPVTGAAAQPPPGQPRSVAIVSVVDSSATPPLSSPVVNGAFTVTAEVRDAQGNPVAAAGRTVRLAVQGKRPKGAKLTGTLTAVTDGTGTATFIVQYSAVTSSLRLRASSPGLRHGTATTTVASAAGEPFSPLAVPPIAIGTSTIGADLPNGSFGPVTLTYQNAPCQFGLTGQCATATLDGTFTGVVGGDTVHLYSFQNPASVTITCSVANCPPVGQVYLDQWGEFAAYPIQVSLKVNGAYQPFATAPACVGLNNDPVTGQIIDSAAQAAGFCVDVYAIYRDESTQDLVRPILFVEDPRFTPISR